MTERSDAHDLSLITTASQEGALRGADFSNYRFEGHFLRKTLSTGRWELIEAVRFTRADPKD